jgi:thioredoxin-dependent peroxiredoxin
MSPTTSAAGPEGEGASPLRLGEPLPDLTVQTTAGPLKLSDLAGRKLVLYFYPKDNTPGCTTEGADFAEHHGRFLEAGCEIYGVSRDSLKSHAGFKAKMSFPFELISDPDETLCERFGVMKMKNMYGRLVRGVERSTFVIDPAGRLVREWRGVKVPGHVTAVLDYVSEL